MRVIKVFILATVVGVVVFSLRVGADALYLHIHRDETSFPPWTAVYFGFERWLWFVVPFMVVFVTAVVVGELRKSNSSQAPAA